ncbi:MAG: glycosyltransferase family 39 protein [Nitrosopumilus sp.]|nr:glycosyltransferase family 39 protein [Nitrosopumilus sp.]
MRKKVKKDINISDKVEKPETKSIKIKNNQIIPWIVFLFSISIVLISFVSVMFPALILVSDTVIIPGVEPVTPDPYEMGIWSGGVIIASLITFGLVFLYFKNKLPRYLSSIFEKLFSFEISKKVALIVMLVLLIIYISTSSAELATQEIFEDYKGVKNRLESWSPDQMVNSFEPHVRYFFLKSSMVLFGNDRIIPLLASAALLIVTYFLTKTITQKRFAGIVAVIILMQSNVFLVYDTTVSYTNFWILFYLLSLYLVYRFWPLSPVSYLLSIPSKALTAVFLPMSIYFILRSDISRKQKMIITGITAGIILAGGAASLGGFSTTQGTEEEFDAKELWMGFTSFSYQLRFDGLVLLFMIPLIVGLFLVSKRGIKHGESIMVLISGMLLIAPILTGFTNQTNQPYRFVPLVVFFAIGVGVLLSKRQVE